MAKLCPLFSSSSGNCTYLSSGRDAILIDAGESCKQILMALEQRELDYSDLRGILITHSHSDHVKGLRVLLKKLHIPVYATRETLGSLLLEQILSPDDLYYDITETKSMPTGFSVEAFPTSHDCPGSCGYVISFADGEKLAFCTDLGIITDAIRNKLKGCKTVVMESNHDVGMLQNGPYPFATKQRILSEEGHLSNVSCATELPSLVQSGTTRIVLAHLSRDNNTPDLARVTAESVLLEHGFKSERDYTLYIAPRCGGKMLYI